MQKKLILPPFGRCVGFDRTHRLDDLHDGIIPAEPFARHILERVDPHR